MSDVSYVTPSGVIVPDTDSILADVQAEWQTAFGNDLILTANTPQGVMITAEVLARDAFIRNLCALANQINPNQAGGIFLDGLWALTGGQRVQQTTSLIPNVTVTGQPGATLPRGSQASVGLGGPIFTSVADVDFAPDGTASIAFQSVDYGPVGAPVGTLTQIVSGVLGWETVTNPTAAVLGLSTESDQASRARRNNTLAAQGTALTEAIKSNVYATTGVRSAVVRENWTGAAIVIETVNLVAHSFYACVDGGDDLDVATALVRKKSLGCNWNGGVTVDVTDPASGQIYPVKFDRPTPVPIYMIVTVRGSVNVPDPAATVRSAILAYAGGADPSEEGFDVGGDVSPFEIGGAINLAAPDLFVVNVFLGTAPAPTDAITIPMNINQIATILEGNITVNVV